MKKFHGLLLIGCSALVLAGCGADDVVAPNGPITVNPSTSPSPSPSASASPTPGASVTAAAGCTAGTTDGGTIVLQNSRGTIRNCVIPANITAALTLSGRRADGVMYSLNGRTEVGTDVAQGGTGAVLTVLPGVTVFGATAESNLVVNRGSRLVADGAADQPIIFTARANLTGGLVDSSDNLWGGIIINGRAPISDCQVPPGSSTVGGDANCWRGSEGIVPRPSFGGNIANDNSGILRFVQINFTGVAVGVADEIQGLTGNGLGSGTVIEHLQIHNSRDDGVELFGGTVNMKNLVLTGNADDSLDTDTGYRGSVQYVLAVRRTNPAVAGDTAGNQTLAEIDSSGNVDTEPRQALRLANFTFIQNTPNEPAIRIRGGADVTMLNGIVIAKAGGSVGCFDVDDQRTVDPAGSGPQKEGPPVLRSVAFDCQTLIDADADTFEATTLANPANSEVRQSFTNTLATLTGVTVGNIAPGSNESGVPAATNITAVSTYFTQANYIGAFSGPADTWTVGWTCNSDVANVRGLNSCTDIRIS